MVTFYRLPRGRSWDLRTTNTIESPFAALRRRRTRRHDSRRSPTRPPWNGRFFWSRNASSGMKSPDLLSAVAAGQQYHGSLLIRGADSKAAA